MDAAVKLSCEAAADVHVKVLREAKAIQVARDVQRGLMSDPTDDNLSDKEKRRIADAEWAAALAEIKKMWDTARDKLFADYVCPATKKIATNLFASVSGKSTEMNFPDFVHLIERLLYARNSTQAVQSFLQCFNIADFNAVPRAELYRAFTLPLTLYRILIHLRAMDRDQLGAHRTALDQKIDQSAEDQEYRKARTEELKGAEERIELWESFSRFLGLQTVANCSETVGIEQLVGEGNPLFNWRVKIDAQEMFERLTSESSGNLTQLDTREIRRLFQNPRTQHIWDLTGCWPMQLPQLNNHSPSETGGSYRNFVNCFKKHKRRPKIPSKPIEELVAPREKPSASTDDDKAPVAEEEEEEQPTKDTEEAKPVLADVAPSIGERTREDQTLCEALHMASLQRLQEQEPEESLGEESSEQEPREGADPEFGSKGEAGANYAVFGKADVKADEEIEEAEPKQVDVKEDQPQEQQGGAKAPGHPHFAPAVHPHFQQEPEALPDLSEISIPSLADPSEASEPPSAPDLSEMSEMPEANAVTGYDPRASELFIPQKVQRAAGGWGMNPTSRQSFGSRDRN
eukprot:TRINITY_DN6356_c0_g2_i8.p1 TRINITY_DN6356_c0_g2~~TRINITY_DN6356_c0_g2_i8.p1  ORF type:complete len:573 (+),score=178.45 TRINITY_DN6356_c0_g2_i8:174-1892(+)